MTLNGHFTLNSVFAPVRLEFFGVYFESNCVKTNKGRPIMSAAEMFSVSVLYIPRSIGGGGIKTVGEVVDRTLRLEGPKIVAEGQKSRPKADSSGDQGSWEGQPALSP